jgi:flagellar motility protein MotE (MotC chaperone)
MLKILQSEWTATFLGTVLYLVTLAMCFHPPPPAVEDAATEKERPPLTSTSWTYYNPEADQLIIELKERKAALDQREAALRELEKRIQAERQELTSVTQAVWQIQENYNKNVLRLQESEMANLKKLVKTYKNMPPEDAVASFKQMDDNSVAKILKLMKEDEAAPILSLLTQQGGGARAAAIVERMRASVIEPATPKTP